MLLSIQQRYILESLHKLGCIRKGQLLALTRGRHERDGFSISEGRFDAMLRQLRMAEGDVRMDGEMVWVNGSEPDPRRLEAIDVMLELSECRPEDFSARTKPPVLLQFSVCGEATRLFTVSLFTSAADIEQPSAGGRTIWLSDSGVPPQNLSLPRKHFFAARQEGGSHRFYGSNRP